MFRRSSSPLLIPSPSPSSSRDSFLSQKGKRKGKRKGEKENKKKTQLFLKAKKKEGIKRKINHLFISISSSSPSSLHLHLPSHLLSPKRENKREWGKKKKFHFHPLSPPLHPLKKERKKKKILIIENLSNPLVSYFLSISKMWHFFEFFF